MTDFTILGQTVRTPRKTLESFPTPVGVTEVELTSDEVTALCPVTGQPDWYTVTIRYSPGDLCVESKSLKLYLWSFREEGHFCEALASQIAQDISQAINPQWVEVQVKSTPRGGIAITSRAVWEGE